MLILSRTSHSEHNKMDSACLCGNYTRLSKLYRNICSGILASHFFYVIRDEIRSFFKFSIRSSFKIGGSRVSLQGWLEGRAGAILNELRIANFPKLLISSLENAEIPICITATQCHVKIGIYTFVFVIHPLILASMTPSTLCSFFSKSRSHMTRGTNRSQTVLTLQKF